MISWSQIPRPLLSGTKDIGPSFAYPWGCTLHFTMSLSISMKGAARFENMRAVKVTATQGTDTTGDALLGHLYDSLSSSLVSLSKQLGREKCRTSRLVRANEVEVPVQSVD
jgi:hypothetical protein